LRARTTYIERRHLEGHVMLAAGRFRFGTGAEQRDAVMVAIAAEEHGATRHHVVTVDVRNAETQRLRVELRGAFQVLHVKRDMPDLADTKRHAYRPGKVLDVISVHSCNLPVRNRSSVPHYDLPFQYPRSEAHHAANVISRCRPALSGACCSPPVVAPWDDRRAGH
jgi:hypothetical protein